MLSIKEIVSLILLAYRGTIHGAIGDTPAYMVYGTDPRPAEEHDWRRIRSIPEKERLKFLSLARWDLMVRARLHGDLARRRANEGRTDELFKEGDLVLCRLRPKELAEMARHEGSEKVIPK